MNKIDTKALREKILDLAMRGKLVPQDPNDEPASVLLENIKKEKEQLVKDKVIKKQKPLPPIEKDEEPFEIPNSWEWVRLGEIGTWGAGATPNRKKNDFYKNGNIPWVKTGDLNNGFITHKDVEESITQLALEKYSFTTIHKDSILIAMYGATIGKLAISQDIQHMVSNQACCVGNLIWKQMNVLYIFYSLQSFHKTLIKQSAGGTQPNISKQKIINFLVPLPPLSEQQRIVSKIEELFVELDKIDKAQEKYDSAANKLREKVLDAAMRGKLVPQDPNDEPASELLKRIEDEKQKLIKEKVIKKQRPLSPIEKDEEPFEIPNSWEWVRLGEICQLVTDGAHKRPTYVEKGIPFLSVKDITSGIPDFKNTKFISKDAHQILSKRCKPQKNDILLSKVGTIGVPAIVNTDKEFNIFVSVALLRFNNNFINKNFLYYNIQSQYIQKQARRNTRGIANKNWVIREIHNTKTVFPPLLEQQRIVDTIEKFLKILD